MLIKTDHSFDRSITPALTRRGFFKMGGALMVSFTFPGLSAIGAEVQPETSHLASWLEIRHDNTILVRTGRTEIGTGMSALLRASHRRRIERPTRINHAPYGRHR